MAAPMEHMMEVVEEKVVFPVKSGGSLVKTPPVFSSDTRCLFCCSVSIIKVYSTVSGECLRELKGHNEPVTGLAINPNNKLQLVSCSLDGQIIVWDYGDGVLLRKIPLSAPLFGLYTSFTDKNKSLFVLKQVSKSEELQFHSGTLVYSLDASVYLNGIYSVKTHKTDLSVSKKDCVLVRQSVVPKLDKFHSSVVFSACSKDRKTTAVGCEASYFVRITKQTLCVRKNFSDKTFVHKTDHEEMTCVACHPRDLCIATGCKDGKILLWYKFLSKSHLRTALHWHALPVKHLAFTAEGSYLLSGGHECVLVKWHYGTQYKDFLPRLDAPINYIGCSSDGTMFSTSQDDNVIKVITNNFTVEQIFQGLTRAHLKTQNSEPIATGLLWDPRSRSLVLNGRPGHLQFYSVNEDKHLYNLDIVQQNYISPENLKQPLSVTDVTGAAFYSDGTWLATAEYWNDSVMSPEIRLKFWQFDDEKQSYILNTTVELPHDQRVASLEFRPHSETAAIDTEHMLVTSSGDGKFKTWLLVDDTDIYRKNTKWTCDSVGYYQNLPAGKISFSEDGSLLAVVFGFRITLWEPETCFLNRTLVQNMNQEEVRFVQFGRHQCCQYLVSCTSSRLCIWDLVSCSVTWSVDQGVTSLACDLVTENMAVFTENKDLFVFKPSLPDPVFSHVAVSKSNILSAVFMPQTQKNIYGQTTLSWQNGSQLYYMNSEQELKTVSFETETVSPLEQKELVTVEQNLPQTALSLIVSGNVQGQTSDEVKLMQKSVARQPSGSYLKEVLSSASHTLPSVTAFCQPFIKSLLISRKQSGSKELSEEDEGMSGTILSPWQQSQTGITDSGLESDMETDWSQENNELSVSQTSSSKIKERTETQSSLSNTNQTNNEDNLQISEVQQYSDAEISDLIANDVDWYSSLKISSVSK